MTFNKLIVTAVTREPTPFKIVKHVDATVEVTTGFWRWKKTETRKVCRDTLPLWYFADTGEYTPDFAVETLERAWNVIAPSDLNTK